MKFHRAVILDWRFLVAAGLVICGSILGVRVSSSGSFAPRKQKSSQEEIRDKLASGELRVENLSVKNRTRSFELVGLERSSDKEGIVLRLKNSYAKRITAFQLSIGGARTKVELVFNESEWITPGTIFELPNEAEPELDTQGIVVLSVIFEDGTSDGDLNSVRELKEYRSGVKVFAKTFLSELEKMPISSSETDTSSMLLKLRSKVSALTENEGPNVPFHVRLGFHDEKSRTLQQLNGIEQHWSRATTLEERQQAASSGLAEITARYKTVLTALNYHSAGSPK